MDLIQSSLFLWFVIALLEITVVVFTLLFMYWCAKYRNRQLSVGWYICGALFSVLTLIVFLVKRKDFPKPDSKVCYLCGQSYPETSQQCEKCLIDLPEINSEAKKKEKKLSRGFGIATVCTYIAIISAGIAFGVAAGDVFDLDMNDRISVDGVFYDKMGNAYEDEESVLFYDEKGNTYTFAVEEYTDADGWTYEENFYIRDDGEKYFELDCYVTEDGWFYCDKACLLEPYYVDTSNMSEEELDEYYRDQVNSYSEDYEYKYYNYPYTDDQRNYYYAAYEASWNENGELITAENDPSVK